MLTIAICEKEEKIVGETQKSISEVFAAQNLSVEIKIFDSYKALAFDLNERVYDIILLSTVIDNMSGISFAKMLRAKNVEAQLIFLSETARYALDSYDLCAYFYFIKPLDMQKFSFVMHRLAGTFATSESKTVTLQRSSKYITIMTNDIVSVESEGHNINISLKKGEVLTFGMKLNDFEQMVKDSPEFIRIHQSILLNARYINTIDIAQAQLADGRILPLSRSLKTTALEKYKNWRAEK